MFRGRLNNPYPNLWGALILGALLAAILIGVFQVISFGASLSVFFEWLSATGVILVVGGAVVLAYFMPLAWLAQKFNLGGIGSAIASVALLLVVGVNHLQHSFPRMVFIVNLGCCTLVFIYLAYYRQPSNQSLKSGTPQSGAP